MPIMDLVLSVLLLFGFYALMRKLAGLHVFPRRKLGAKSGAPHIDDNKTITLFRKRNGKEYDS